MPLRDQREMDQTQDRRTVRVAGAQEEVNRRLGQCLRKVAGDQASFLMISWWCLVLTATTKTHFILGFSKRRLNIILRLPNSRDTDFIISKVVFKFRPQRSQYRGVRRLFFELSPQSQPSSSSK